MLQLGMASALETLCGQSYSAKKYHMLGIYLQRSWIIIFACAVILLPVYLFTRAPARGARPGPADLRRRWHHLALVHPRHVLLRLVLHAPDVPAGAEQEHDQLIITYLAMLNLGLHLALSWLMTVRFRLGLAGLMGSMVIAM